MEKRLDKSTTGHLPNRKVKSLTNLHFAFPVRDQQARSFGSTINLAALQPRINETLTSDFHQTTSPRTATFDVRNGPVTSMSDRGTGALVVAKEGTVANTVRTTDTETKVEDVIRQGLQKIFPHVNKNLVNLFQSIPQVLANSRENNTNKSYMNYFIKWQKWANQFPEVNATPAEEIYIILYLLSVFQNNKSYPVIQRLYYAIKYFNEYFTGRRELGSHFIAKVLEGTKQLSGYTENPKSPLFSSRDL